MESIATHLDRVLDGRRRAGSALIALRDLWSHLLQMPGLEGAERSALWDAFLRQVVELEKSRALRVLEFGELLLLRPEALKVYRRALRCAAREEADGQGFVSEARILGGFFAVPYQDRVASRDHEEWILLAVLLLLVRKKRVMRLPWKGETVYFFPSEVRRPEPSVVLRAVSGTRWDFHGDAGEVFLEVFRELSCTSVFSLVDVWEHGASWSATIGGRCSLEVHRVGEGRGALSARFDARAFRQTRVYFEGFVASLLEHRGGVSRVVREPVFPCSECTTPVTPLQVSRRRQRGYAWLLCCVCGEKISLKDTAAEAGESLQAHAPKLALDAEAFWKKQVSALKAMGKRATRDFDLWLCHDDEDPEAVERLASWMRDWGAFPWMEREERRSGESLERAMRDSMGRFRGVLVVISGDGVPWDDPERGAALEAMARVGRPVGIVLMPSVEDSVELPEWLDPESVVDFREFEDRPAEQLQAWVVRTI